MKSNNTIPPVSDAMNGSDYARYMVREAKWKNWGARFRMACRLKGLTLSKVAESMGNAESTLRSWTNGTRQINLTEFFTLCDAAGIDPYPILFTAPEDDKLLAVLLAWGQADDSDKRLMSVAANAVLANHKTNEKFKGSHSK